MTITDEGWPRRYADATGTAALWIRSPGWRTSVAGRTACGVLVLARLTRHARPPVGPRVAPIALAIRGIEERERKLGRAVGRARGRLIWILRLQTVQAVISAGCHGASHVLKDSGGGRIKIEIIEVDPVSTIAANVVILEIRTGSVIVETQVTCSCYCF